MAITNSELEKSGNEERETRNGSNGENQVLLDTKGSTARIVSPGKDLSLNGNPIDTGSALTKQIEAEKSLLEEGERQVPKDRHRLVYLIFLLHGIGVLMAWNMFITAKSYFVDYKLNVDVIQSRTNMTAQELDKVSSYRTHFLSFTGIAAQIPNVLCNGLNLFLPSSSGNMNLRVTAMISIEIIVYIVTIVLALVDSTSWPGTFFYITMTSIVIMNMANGVYQSAVYGIAAKLPMSYSNAVVLGSNICGTLVSIIAIVSMAISPDIKSSAVFYFVATLLVLILCLVTFHLLPFNRFYRYFESSGKEDDSTRPAKRQFLFVFKKIWPQCLNVFMVFFVTLAVFPAIHADIETSGQLAGLKSFFSPVTCFLIFNSMAMVGNIIPNWWIWPGPKKLWMPVFSRLLFIPFFLLCNYKPLMRSWPVLIRNDWVYLIGSILFGLTSGYYSSLGMMYAPREVDGEHAATAAMMAAFFLMLGIFSGVASSFFWAWIV